jgi:hypothetical protein
MVLSSRTVMPKSALSGSMSTEDAGLETANVQNYHCQICGAFLPSGLAFACVRCVIILFVDFTILGQVNSRIGVL